MHRSENHIFECYSAGCSPVKLFGEEEPVPVSLDPFKLLKYLVIFGASGQINICIKWSSGLKRRPRKSYPSLQLQTHALLQSHCLRRMTVWLWQPCLLYSQVFPFQRTSFRSARRYSAGFFGCLFTSTSTTLTVSSLWGLRPMSIPVTSIFTTLWQSSTS